MTTQKQEITPDQLLESFRGRSFKSVITFTIIVHVVFIGATSVPYLMKLFKGNSASELSEYERTEIAAREATDALHDIATKHGIKPQDLSSRISNGNSPASPKKAAPVATVEPAAKESTPTEAVVEPDVPKSAVEKQLEAKEAGPKVPTIPVEETTDEDLFAK